MHKQKLGRREALSGGLATILATAPIKHGDLDRTTLHAIAAEADADLLAAEDFDRFYAELARQQEVSSAQFQAAFHSWLPDARERFILPFSTHTMSTSETQLCLREPYPSINIYLWRPFIKVFVCLKERIWYDLYSQEILLKPAEYGFGWQTLSHNDFVALDDDEALLTEEMHLKNLQEAFWQGTQFECLFAAELAEDGFGLGGYRHFPKETRIHPTQDDCWKNDAFEPLLNWLNETLAAATHLAFWGGDPWDEDLGPIRFVRLVKDGVILHSEIPLSSVPTVRELLPLHAFTA